MAPFLLFACSVDDSATATSHTVGPPGASADRGDLAVTGWREQRHRRGRETYERACAPCHDQPGEGMPGIRDRDSWGDRSPLWSSVLLQHAKSGFMDMQPRGGEFGLSDRAVEAAGEYMLSETFPELPRD